MSALSLAGTQAKKIAVGQHTSVAASDEVSTGLSTVEGVVVSLGNDPAAVGAGEAIVTASPSATAGNITVKTWEADGTVGTQFGQVVNYFAWGT